MLQVLLRHSAAGLVNGHKVVVRAGAKGPNLIRVLVHHQVSQEDVDCVIERLKQPLYFCIVVCRVYTYNADK